MTQEKSKVLHETEQNPFIGDDEENDNAPTPPAHTRNSSVASTSAQQSSSSLSGSFFGSAPTAAKQKSRKDKKGKKSKAFDLEAEKETMKSCIAESSVASINLLNGLRLINRETERISDNQSAVQQFESCKLLRRKILRYVCALILLIQLYLD